MDHLTKIDVFVLGKIDYEGWHKHADFWPKGFDPKARVMIAVNEPFKTLQMFPEWLSSNLLGRAFVEDFRMNNIWYVYFEELDDATMFFLRFK